MWARLSDPGTYQAFQHFITHAPWDAEAVWKRLREVVPERTGVLILDGTSFPKQGTASVGVARQVLRRARQDRELPDGGHGRAVDRRAGVAAGRDAVSARGVAHRHASGRGRRSPRRCAFEPKWRLALTLLRQVRAAGFTVTAVVGDAEFGDNATLRRTLHRAKLPYALGVSSDLKVFLGTPALESRRR